MRNLIKVEGIANLYKDPTTNTFINMDNSGIEQARAIKKARIKKEEENQQLKSKVDSLTNELTELKSMVQQLLEK